MLFSVYYRLSKEEGVSSGASRFLPSGSHSTHNSFFKGPCGPASPSSDQRLSPGWHSREKMTCFLRDAPFTVSRFTVAYCSFFFRF